MNRNKPKAIVNITFLILIITSLSLLINQGYCVTTDSDTVIKFYWGAATGTVAKYNVYLSTNGSGYVLVGTTTNVPTMSAPYTVPVTAVNGSSYNLKVEAVNSNSAVGPMSDPSDSVLCQCKLSYIIASSSKVGGTITPSGSVTVNQGASQTFKITPLVGYVIQDVKVDGTSAGAIGTYTFSNVSANHTIEASYIKTYTITASAGLGGTITLSGSVKVNQGTSQTFTITPIDKYVIQNVKVDGTLAGAVNKYTFTNVAANHTIVASFKKRSNPGVLLQNFPNPFNPETWIPYQLNEDSDVTVRIYDLTGKLVRTLRLGYKPTGMYLDRDKAVYWDGKNESGEGVVSGTYFYSIQAGNITATRKMIISR